MPTGDELIGMKSHVTPTKYNGDTKSSNTRKFRIRYTMEMVIEAPSPAEALVKFKTMKPGRLASQSSLVKVSSCLKIPRTK